MGHISIRWLLVTILLLPLTHAVANTNGDPIANAWRQRAQVAAKKLAEPGLDACDRGIELAFQKAKESTTGTIRTYELLVQVSKQTLRAAYSYEGQKLSSFELISLPPNWFARQRVDSKTLSIIVGTANCAMDFCTDNPLVPGSCVGDKPE
jgi:hypothetical protein